MTIDSLSSAFLETTAPAPVDRSALDASLTATLADVRARWPRIAVSDRELARDLGARWVSDAESPLPAWAAELALACACLRGDEAALRAFDVEMFARVGAVLARLGVVGSDADDIGQEVRAKLLVAEGDREPKLALYQGTGPLAHWVASVAGRVALTAMRRRRPSEALDDDDLLDATDDPQMMALKSRHRADFKEAFQAAVAELEPRDRAVLRALVVDNRSVNEIAAVYGIHRVTASRRIAEIRHALLHGTRKRLRQRLALDEPSLDSAIRLIDSNLDLSLYRLLSEAA